MEEKPFLEEMSNQQPPPGGGGVGARRPSLPQPLITSEEDVLKQFVRNFTTIAVVQGRFAYLLMSIHVVNPNIWYSMCQYNPRKLLVINMLYGVSFMIYSRPAMKPISFLNRLSFGVLGSLMFNYSSLQALEWVKSKVSEDRPYLLTFLGFLTGRLFMIHLLAYLYHVDRCARAVPQRNPAFDSMYS